MKEKTLLLIDNYDSFTYNLYDYFRQLGATCEVIRNDALSLGEFTAKEFDALVLSPGPGIPENAGLMMSLIAHFHNKKPILGICLGHQGIGEFFGAKLKKAKLPMHGKTSRIQHNGDSLFEGLPEAFEVMRYHSLLLENIENTPLHPLAKTDEGEIMALAHETLPIIGIQFHPESILTQHGIDILRNWLNHIPPKFQIRLLKATEIKTAYELIKASFLEFNTAELGEGGQEKILAKAINETHMEKRFARGTYFLAAFLDGEMAGVAEMTTKYHLRLLYIKGMFHRKGLGKCLVDELIRMAKDNGAEFLTVNAALSALPFYQKYGFTETDELQDLDGVRFVPMQFVF